MEDESDGEIYSDLSGSCSETTSDTKDSRCAITAELDILDTSVLPGVATLAKKDDRPQVVRQLHNRSAVYTVGDDGCPDIYSDLGDSCSQSKRSIEEAHSTAAAELDLLDTSVLPRQSTPLKKDGPPKTKTFCAPERSIVAGSETSSTALSITAQATIAALKKENGILRHNISVLYKTAKHLLDSRDKEIVSLQRRLDNLVFKRNLGSQSSPLAVTTPTSARGPQQRSQRQSHSSWNSPGTPTAERPYGPSPQERSHPPDPAKPKKPKVDMSGDLQRLYEYNNVRPKYRTEYSQVPELVIASRKNEIAAKVPGTPTKSAAQRNAKRLIRNSIKKISGSPTKLPRRMEVNRRLGLSPLKRRRVSERTPLAARFTDSPHQERRGASSQASPKDRPMDPRSMLSRTPPIRHRGVAKRPYMQHESWSPEPHFDCYMTPPSRKKGITKGPHTPPENEPPAKHIRTPPLTRRVTRGPQAPPECSPQLVTEHQRTPPLEGQRTAKGPHTPPGKPPPEPPTESFETTPLEKVAKQPPEDHAAEVCASQSKQEAGANEQARKVVKKSGEATSRPSKLQDLTTRVSKPSGKGLLHQRLGIKRRISPSGPARSTQPPPSSLSEDVEFRRARSPREMGDYRSLLGKRRRSRSRSYSRSPPPRPYSPREHPQPRRISLHDRLDIHHAKHRTPRYHRHSPEPRAMRRRSRERFSPQPRRHHRPERRPAYSPSPPRLGRTPGRHSSPGRRPKSPSSKDKHAIITPLCKRPTKMLAKMSSSVEVNIGVTSEQDKGETCVEAVHQAQETPCQSSEAAAECVPENETLAMNSTSDAERTEQPSEKMHIGAHGDG